jgi:hypothetical protein
MCGFVWQVTCTALALWLFLGGSPPPQSWVRSQLRLGFSPFGKWALPSFLPVPTP